MEIDLYQLLKDNSELMVFAVIGIGYLIGRVPLGPIRLENIAGVLLAGAIFGHLGLGQEMFAFHVGFILFIYSVGLQAGPHFFSVFALDGKRYVALVLFTGMTALGVSQACASFFGFSPTLAAGTLSGALTSTPTLAGAQDALRGGLVVLEAGQTVSGLIEELSIGYAIAYLFGTAGLMILVRVVPLVMRIDLAAEARKASAHMRLREIDEETPRGGQKRPLIRAYRVQNADLLGKTLREIELPARADALILKIKRDDRLIGANADSTLEEGDVVSLLAPLEGQRRAESMFGASVLDGDLVGIGFETRDVVVTRNQVAGRSVDELDLIHEYGVLVTRVSRSMLELPLSPQLELQKGDVLRATGPSEELERFALRIGQAEVDVYQTDLATFAFGICAGLLVGSITIKVGNVPIGLGAAGGLLLSGILVGFLRVSNPSFGRMPRSVRWVFMELGLMFFMAGVGLRAGPGLAEALDQVGLAVFFAGMIMTSATLVLGFLFGRLVLRMNPALLLGAMTGAMTSTPALGIVTRVAQSSIPSVGYAGTYPFANILLALIGAVLVRT